MFAHFHLDAPREDEPSPYEWVTLTESMQLPSIEDIELSQTPSRASMKSSLAETASHIFPADAGFGILEAIFAGKRKAAAEVKYEIVQNNVLRPY